MFRNAWIILFVIIMAIGLSVAFGLFTTKGSQLIATEMLQKYTQGRDIQINESTGNLAEGITFKDLDLDQIKGLPEGSRLKIQEVFINFRSLSLDGLMVKIDNARLMLPDSEPIVIAGIFENQELNFNIFSRGFTVNEVLGYLPNLRSLVPLKGEINGVDLYVKGSFHEPEITGDFIMEKFIYKGFVLSDSSCRINITMKDMEDNIKLYGRVNIKNGTLDTQKVLVKLESGDINFSGPWDRPDFIFKGNSKVENTKININLKGTLEKPELKLTSEPSFSEQKLMVMLATGKSWQGVEDTIETGAVSSGLTKDFIDYFLFAGRGNAFAKKFGVRDFTVKFDKNTKGLGVKKDFSDKLEVGYGLEQRTTEEKSSSLSQKIQGEYQVTGRVSVGVEKEVIEERTDAFLDDVSGETGSNDKVYLKYKKEF